MPTFVRSKVVEVLAPGTGQVQYLEVESARGGGLIYAGSKGEAGRIAGVEDRAAARISQAEAVRLVEEHRSELERWTIQDLSDKGEDEGLVLSQLVDEDGEAVGWCVRGVDGTWQSEVQPDAVQAEDVLEARRQERRPRPPGPKG